MKPNDVGARLVLPTASYFGLVANSYIMNAVLPPSKGFGMVDIVVLLGLSTIFGTALLSLMSNYFFDKKGDVALALALDRALFCTVTACCIAADVAISVSVFH